MVKLKLGAYDGRLRILSNIFSDGHRKVAIEQAHVGHVLVCSIDILPEFSSVANQKQEETRGVSAFLYSHMASSYDVIFESFVVHQEYAAQQVVPPKDIRLMFLPIIISLAIFFQSNRSRLRQRAQPSATAVYRIE